MGCTPSFSSAFSSNVPVTIGSAASPRKPPGESFRHRAGVVDDVVEQLGVQVAFDRQQCSRTL